MLSANRVYCSLPNGLRFRSGPSSSRNTQKDATTGASRTIDAQSRLALTPTHQKGQAAFCKRLLCSTFGCHNEIDLAIEDVKQRDLLSQALSSVRGIQQSIQLR